MKIGIIIHSKTGTTLTFAKLIKNRLVAGGHEVTLTELTTDVKVSGGSAKHPMPFKVTNIPDVSEYDAVCIGGPVWAFGASPVIYQALQKLDGLKGKKVLPFVTMGFPFAGMGGNNALKMMSQVITGKGGKAMQGFAVPKMFRNQPKLMADAVHKIGNLFL